MAKQPNPRQLTREEYRRALLIERRRTMRTVRNTLIGIAVIAALWFVLLLAKDRALRQAGGTPPSAPPVETVPADVPGSEPASPAEPAASEPADARGS